MRTGWGWNMLLAEAGLVDVRSRSFLLDLPPPLTPRPGASSVASSSATSPAAGERLGSDDRATLARLLDDDDPRSIMRRPDVFVLSVRTVHAGTRALADDVAINERG